MKIKAFPAPLLAFAWAVCAAALTSCDATSSAAREAARQFALGWDENLAHLGAVGLADPIAARECSGKLEPHRKIIRAQGSQMLRRDAEQIDTLISYVARTMQEHLAAWKRRVEALGASSTNAVPPGVRIPPRPPITFPDAKLNALLGVDAPWEPEEDPGKLETALRQAVIRFAKGVGAADEIIAREKEREEARTELHRKLRGDVPSATESPRADPR